VRGNGDFVDGKLVLKKAADGKRRRLSIRSQVNEGSIHMRQVFSNYYGFLALMALVISPPNTVFAEPPLGQFEGWGDVGPMKRPGSASYDSEHERYTITAAGTNMWDAQDEFFFAWKRLKGDFQICARARFVGVGKVAHRKMGVIIRKSLDADSPYVDVALHGDGLTSLQTRRAAGEATTQVMAPIAGASIVQLERKGNKYTMRVAWDSEPFAPPREVELDLGDEVYVGLFVCSHDADERVTAEFDNVWEVSDQVFLGSF
jgi:hypothetical protein